MSSTAPSENTAASATARRPARAEHVGSLLRPQKLKALVEETYEPGHSALLEEERAKDLGALHAAEDEAIRDAVDGLAAGRAPRSFARSSSSSALCPGS